MNVPQMHIARPEEGPELRLPFLWWTIGWAIVVFITFSCLAPAHYVPNLHLWDKLEHALAFGGMTVWFGGLARRSRYPIIAFLMLVFGGVIELLQGAMRLGRDEDIMDFVADSVGITIALTALYLGLGAWARWVERLIWPSREP
jgi:VanZ family protein